MTESRRSEIRTKLEALGVDPDRAVEELKKLVAEIQRELIEVGTLLTQLEELVGQETLGAGKDAGPHSGSR